MRRALLFAALLGATAAAPTYPPLAMVEPFGTTPAPPPGPAFIPAPVPDLDAAAPRPRESAPGPHLTPSLFRPGRTYQGEGYTPGSSLEADQANRFRPRPGLNLNVPLQ